jgi:hypothetical protein
VIDAWRKHLTTAQPSLEGIMPLRLGDALLDRFYRHASFGASRYKLLRCVLRQKESGGKHSGEESGQSDNFQEPHS